MAMLVRIARPEFVFDGIAPITSIPHCVSWALLQSKNHVQWRHFMVFCNWFNERK
jgi:hypothetical protein